MRRTCRWPGSGAITGVPDVSAFGACWLRLSYPRGLRAFAQVWEAVVVTAAAQNAAPAAGARSQRRSRAAGVDPPRDVGYLIGVARVASND